MPLNVWPSKRLEGSLIAWNLGGSIDKQPLTIWTDGAPGAQPPGSAYPGRVHDRSMDERYPGDEHDAHRGLPPVSQWRAPQ
jgi:hypothetical protein